MNAQWEAVQHNWQDQIITAESDLLRAKTEEARADTRHRIAYAIAATESVEHPITKDMLEAVIRIAVNSTMVVADDEIYRSFERAILALLEYSQFRHSKPGPGLSEECLGSITLLCQTASGKEYNTINLPRITTKGLDRGGGGREER